MSETPQAPQLTGKMFLFEQPELLSKEQHGGLSITAPAQRYSFCANIRAVPLTISEVPAAMKDYPIVFMSMENPMPLAVVGMVDDVNLFVDEKGDWEMFRYIPGYIRRYPFGLAGESEGERMAMIIDRAFDGVVEHAGPDDMALFDNDDMSERTKKALDFCGEYERDRKVTEQFIQRLLPYGLIKEQTAQFTPQDADQPQPFAQYIAIDEPSVNALSDDQYKELRASNMLPIIYAMMMSMGNWRHILQRRAVRFGLSESEIVQRAIN